VTWCCSVSRWAISADTIAVRSARSGVAAGVLGGEFAA
jgi:hypothetical protein